MRFWNEMRRSLQVFNILLFEHFSNHCLANLIEPLRAANTLARRALYDWQIFTLTGAPVASSSGLQITPRAAFGTETGDTLAVIPSYGYQSLADWPLRQKLQSAAKRHKRLAGYDTGPWLLARAGLLDGYRATIHWDELTPFEEGFPEVDVQRKRYVIDRDRITCPGAMAAFDLSQALIAEAHGPLLAMEVAQLLMLRDSGAGQPLRARNRFVNRALHLMQENLETPLPIAQLARQVGCSQKALERQVREELQVTPVTLYRRLRLNLARRLMRETDMSVAEVAGRAGYENASAMTRAFRGEFGRSPTALRRED